MDFDDEEQFLQMLLRVHGLDEEWAELLSELLCEGQSVDDAIELITDMDLADIDPHLGSIAHEAMDEYDLSIEEVAAAFE